MTQPGPANANDVHHERAFDGVRGGMARMESICSASCGVGAKHTAALETTAPKLIEPSELPLNDVKARTDSGSETRTHSGGSGARASHRGVVQNCRRSSARMP